jgi:4-amino-4-deoxychorismate lyase
VTIWLVDGKDHGVDPADRGLAYGDGLFETMRAVDASIPHCQLHMERLEDGCRRLSMRVPDAALLRREIADVLPARGRRVVKVIVTRGAGARGYRPPETAAPTRVIGVSPWPALPSSNYTLGIDLRTCALRLGHNRALAGLKHLCRLEQVLAQMEVAELGADEGVLLDGEDRVVGGTMSNIFAIQGTTLLTPDLSRCGVRGVMRRIVLEAAPAAGLEAREADLGTEVLRTADEIFVTNAVIGIWPVKSFDGTLLVPGPKTRQLQSMLGYSDVA